MKKTSSFKRAWFFAAVMAMFCIWSGSLFAAEAASGENEFRWGPFLAPFHNVILHLPIGFVLLSCVIEAATIRWPSDDVRRVLGLAHICSALAMVATVVLGLLRAAEGGYEEQTLSNHKITGIIAGVLTVLVLVVHHLGFRREAGKPPLQLVYRLILVGNLGVMSVAGHYGGNLTHGSDYLFANAPEFVKKLVGEGDSAETNATTANASGDPAGKADGDPRLKHFHTRVWPVLEAKCLSCHGKEKQKGGYTLTDKEIAFKGGDSEIEAIVPGNPAKSLLVESILLPTDDDYVMPPDGKEPLTSFEILAIVEWVRDGAVWPVGDK